MQTPIQAPHMNTHVTHAFTPNMDAYLLRDTCLHVAHACIYMRKCASCELRICVSWTFIQILRNHSSHTTIYKPNKTRKTVFSGVLMPVFTIWILLERVPLIVACAVRVCELYELLHCSVMFFSDSTCVCQLYELLHFSVMFFSDYLKRHLYDHASHSNTVYSFHDNMHTCKYLYIYMYMCICTYTHTSIPRTYKYPAYA
jgi:hypothetical protein